MKDIKAIVAAYQKTDLTQRQAAMATVVRVHGSSYRSPGARMLITDDGKWVGSISGGCLEGDALRKARHVMQAKTPLIVTYDTREESNQNLGIGLGCNGVIDVLIEPIVLTESNNPISLFEQIIQQPEPVTLGTIFTSSQPEYVGKKLLLSSTKEIVSSIDDAGVQHLLQKDLHHAFNMRRSEVKKYRIDKLEIEVFVELIQPTVSLILFGGGFDARPVSQLAKALGWEVTVTDECVAHIAPLFFPSADKLSLCQREFIDRDFNITPYTACVLMSHNYTYDRDVLRKIIHTETPYIGILGPRKRFDKMIAEFTQEGVLLTPALLHRIHAPIGLDVGAESPDEIALAIIAEIQSKFSGRSGGFLKYKNGPIHQRDGKGEQVFKQVYLNETDTASSLG